jgi:hypothetical protein
MWFVKRRLPALKMLPAVAILAALFLPLATCHDAAGRDVTLMRGSGGVVAGIPTSAFFVWPLAFATFQLLSRGPRVVRIMVALEPLLSLLSVGVVWFGLTAAALIALFGNFQLAVGAYTAATGFAIYFCISAGENLVALIRSRRVRRSAAAM